MNVQVTGERFVLRANTTYTDQISGETSPGHEDFGPFDQWPTVEQQATALAQVKHLRLRSVELGHLATYGDPEILRQERRSRRILGRTFETWHVVEIAPIGTLAPTAVA